MAPSRAAEVSNVEVVHVQYAPLGRSAGRGGGVCPDGLCRSHGFREGHFLSAMARGRGGADLPVIAADASQNNNLEYQSYQDMVRAGIGATGLVEAKPGAKGRFDVSFNYGTTQTQIMVQRPYDPYFYGATAMAVSTARGRGERGMATGGRNGSTYHGRATQYPHPAYL